MIETDRLIAPEPLTQQEETLERALRPKVLDEYVGQEKVRGQLEIFINAARSRGEPLDHVLLFGPPGLGKTTLAHIIAKEMGVKFPVKVSNGEILRLAPGEPEVVDKVTWGRVYLDGKVLIDNDSPVLKERRNMAANGYMEITVLISKNGQIKNNPIVTLKGIPLIEEDASEIEYDLEDVVMDTCKAFNLNNSKQEKNLIDTLKGNCRKLINDKSGKKPLVNINLVRL